MAKNKARKGRETHTGRAFEETGQSADVISQPDNINIDNNADDTYAGASDDGSETVRLSFGEKVASLFAPVRELKDAAAAAEKRVAELEAAATEGEARIKDLEQRLFQAEKLNESSNVKIELLKQQSRNADDKLVELAKLAESYRAETFVKAECNFPAELQGRFDSYQEMAVALAESEKRAAAAEKSAPRRLEEVLAAPSPAETEALIGHMLKVLSAERIIPSNSTNWRVALDGLRRKDEDIKSLSARLSAVENDLKAAEGVDREAELAARFEADDVSGRIGDAVAPWLQRRINSLIDNESRHLKAVTDLEMQLNDIAEAVARPGSHDEAVADGVRSVLQPLSEHLGRDVNGIDRLAEALSQYFDERMQHEVMARFTSATEDERRSLGALIDASNKALADREKINRLLEKLATDRIEQIYERAIAYHFDDMVRKNRPEVAIEEVMEAFARDNSFDALIRHLVNAVSAVERRRAKASEEADIAIAGSARLEERLKAVEAEREAMVKAHREALADMRGQHQTELLESEARRVADLEKQRKEIEEAHAALTASLQEDIARRDTDIRGLFEACLGTVKSLLRTLADDVAAAYTGDRDNNSVADVIDHSIIENDIYGLEEFSAGLLARLDEAEELTAEAVQRVVRESFADILKIESATWIDNLARLALYSQVPFVAAEFMASGVRIDRFAAAYSALEAILAQGGITLQVPRLFVDTFDESHHNAEAIKNITSVVSDVASHVADSSTVIDLFTVGYSMDGAEVRKPTVSRLDS